MEEEDEEKLPLGERHRYSTLVTPDGCHAVANLEET
jgi:hypothetical protein